MGSRPMKMQKKEIIFLAFFVYAPTDGYFVMPGIQGQASR